MLQIIRQTYEERLKLYNECTKDTLIGFLTQRDKYKNYIKNTPWFLIYKNYNNFSKEHLAEICAEREIYESPDCCK